MNYTERLIPIFVLVLTSLVVGFDLLSDQSQGAALWHLIIEAIIAILAMLVAIWLIYHTLKMRRNLKQTRKEAETNLYDAIMWRAKAQKHIDGLSKAISSQLEEWGLSPSEKEIAFLLIKGLSMREIANFRNTSEKTARAQATTIYLKSGLNGRADLAAFFLEDLLAGK